jgi:hypothetical protein
MLQDESAEIVLNLWFLIDERLGFAYGLLGRAYMMSGSDDNKLRILHTLAYTDHYLAKKFNVPHRYSVVDPAGNERKGLIHPSILMELGASAVFKELIDELENELPPKVIWVDGEMKSEKQKIPEAPLMVCTGLLEYQDGYIKVLARRSPQQESDEPEEGNEIVDYLLEPRDRQIIDKALELLRGIISSNLPKKTERASIEKALTVLRGLPRAGEDHEFISITLVAPTRKFGTVDTHEIYHSWKVEIEGYLVSVMAGGHFYRQSTGGDSFTSMMWSASPGVPAEFSDYLSYIRLVDDAKPFESEIDDINISNGGYRLLVDDYEFDQ